MQEQPTWILLADEGRARILAWRGPEAELEEIERLTDAGAHAHERALERDASGRRAPAGHAAGVPGAGRMPGSLTTSAGEDKLEQEADLFARRIATRLDEAHRARRFDRLLVAAAPKFLGRLRRSLTAQVLQSVAQEIDKDLLNLDSRTLRSYFVPAANAAP